MAAAVLTGGFFGSSGPKLLQPGDIPVQGRTLYLPLPFLPLLRADELGALGRKPDPVALAEATPPPDVMALLSTLFADPGGLCRTATTDFLEMARERTRARYQALKEQVSYETLRGTYVLVSTAALFLLFGAALLVIGMTGPSWSESRLVGRWPLWSAWAHIADLDMAAIRRAAPGSSWPGAAPPHWTLEATSDDGVPGRPCTASITSSAAGRLSAAPRRG